MAAELADLTHVSLNQHFSSRQRIAHPEKARRLKYKRLFS